MNKRQAKRILGAYIVSQLVWIVCVVFIVVFLCAGWKARFLGVMLCLAMSAATALLVMTVVVERDLEANEKISSYSDDVYNQVGALCVDCGVSIDLIASEFGEKREDIFELFIKKMELILEKIRK